jgi:putative Ca2+/H+ antiporter (TMEM165/GDT1 family)
MRASSSTRLWGRSTSNDDNDTHINHHHHHHYSSKWQSFLTHQNKKAAVVASLALLASVALPTISHAVDLDSMYGGAITVASSATGLLSRISETGFYQAFSLVFLSEIGDKTFFIAGLLSMKTSKLSSFVGSMGALIAMTIISVLIGQIFHAVPVGVLGDGLPIDDIFACIAFAFFGFKTLKDALDMEEGESVMDEELAEAEEAVENNESGLKTTPWGQLASIFALVFAAEFGDRSFLSTIALSAAQNPVSVAGGAIAAHGVATGIAVSGGSYLAKYISERVIGIIGGSLFLVFAVTTALGIF